MTLCGKHKIEQYRRKSDDGLDCRLCQRERNKRYASSGKGKQTRQQSIRLWKKTPTGKAYVKRHKARWSKTEAGRASTLRRVKRYQRTVKGRETSRLNRNLLHNKILHRLRKRVVEAIQKGWRQESTKSLLGCSISDFLVYLESKFETGMSWDNYGKVWHIDHIMPCAIFDLTKQEHQDRCFHFSNLQPLFAHDNLVKNCRVTYTVEGDITQVK